MTRTTAFVFASSVALRLASVAAAPAADAVPALPGWATPLRSPHYAGYLASTGGKQLHYHLVLSESAPTVDPVVIWMNGGPPCSSQIGLWLEVGPLSEASDGSGLVENSGRWSQNASLLIMEGPVGVGYSYWPGGPSPPWPANDTTTADDFLAALRSFYAAFPELASRDLWITGESYAGVYVPTLARAVLAAGLSTTLRGILVGNGAVATGTDYEAGLVRQRMEHAFAHSLFSIKTRAAIDAACDPDWVNRSPACSAALSQMSAEVGPLNAYNIEVTCGNGERLRSLLTGTTDASGPLDNGADPCTAADNALTTYLQSAAVRTALHVSSSAGTWAECAGGGAVRYTREPGDERTGLYPQLLSAGLHVLIYNGDQDECIPLAQVRE